MLVMCTGWYIKGLPRICRDIKVARNFNDFLISVWRNPWIRRENVGVRPVALIPFIWPSISDVAETLSSTPSFHAILAGTICEEIFSLNQVAIFLERTTSVRS